MRAADTRSEREAARGYRFSYLARKYGLSQKDARDLIALMGQDRLKLNAAARDLLLRRDAIVQPPAVPAVLGASRNKPGSSC